MADITIGELTRAENVAAEDLFVLEKESVAYSLTGDTLKDFLLELADSLGGISSISKTSTSGLVDTYTITYSRTGETSTFNVTNGTSERIYIKYAEDRPVTDAEMSDEPNNWIGIYTGQDAPSSFRDYAWFQFKGNQGDKGDDGNIPIIEAGNTETLPSGSDATFNVEPTSVGYRLNVGIPRGVDGTGAGTVTSVGITAGSGISVEGSPVTSAGSIIVGHSNELDPQNTEKLFKFSYDANGHVTSSSALEVGKDFGALSFKVTLFAMLGAITDRQ